MAGVSLVDDRAALLSMRNSDFDAYSAVGEVIDNSIQAGAHNVRLIIDFSADRHEPITAIAFGDDGSGMSGDILHRCLQLGYSTRYNDRRGIGRFGVGATLAAISQCRKIEVSSKEERGPWLYTYIDLDAITADPPTMKQIPPPTQRAVPEELRALVGPASGTLVVWSKCDRQPAPASKLLEELKVWIGRTYRKFIWDGVRIFINGDIVKAIDPLYVTTARTKFPRDPKAHEYEEMLLPWPIPLADRQDGGPAESIVRIRMSLLPEAFRPTEESGHGSAAKERCIDLNEGVSILRNKREVFYDVIPWWPGIPFRGIDRWWGCEISFDAVLDSQFTVKNIKRGAVPVRELKQAIKERIEPTRHAALERIRDHWREAEALARADEQQLPLWRAKRDSQPVTVATDQWRDPVVPPDPRRQRTRPLVFGLLLLLAFSAGAYVAWPGGRGVRKEPSLAGEDLTPIPPPRAEAPRLRQLRVAQRAVTTLPPADTAATDSAPAPPPPRPEPVPVPAAGRTGFVLGSGQRGRVGEPATLPVVFEVRDSSGTALPGVAVSLSIVNGRLVGPQRETDSLGQVRAQVVFGPRAGVATVVTGTVGALVREASLYPAAGTPAKLVVVFDGNALASQIVVPAGGTAELRISCRDAFDNALPLVGLRATVGDDRVVGVTGVAADSLGGVVTVQAGRGGATNLVILGSGLRADLSAVVSPAAASP